MPLLPKRTRRPRVDGQRNRDLIVQIAKQCFAETGAETSMDHLAKRAGVGSGTLYRHFPNRETLLEAVYRAEVEKLAEAAESFAQELSPIDALRAWLHLFVDYLATKKVIAAALSGLVNTGKMFDDHMAKVHEAVQMIYRRAAESGDIRADIYPVDHLRAIVGIAFFSGSEDWRDSAIRLVDTLILGSRP